MGGLGAKTGPAVAYVWTPPSLMPVLLPWLAMLVLLLLKPNRSGQAWWVGLPLACGCSLASAVPALLSFIPSEPADLLTQLITALTFGVAAVWLLSSHLAHRLRVLSFLGTLATLSGFSLLTLLVRLDWADNQETIIPGLIGLGFGSFVLGVTLSLAGLVCRRQYYPVRLSLALLGCLITAWLLVLSPFMVFGVLLTGGEIPWRDFLIAVSVFAGAGFLILLPFLLLSFIHPFYRQRLIPLLHLERASPHLPVPEAPVSAATGTKN